MSGPVYLTVHAASDFEDGGVNLVCQACGEYWNYESGTNLAVLAQEALIHETLDAMAKAEPLKRKIPNV